jgi:uncharacterized membrane protein YphA (DoxX/SURF4 family)
MHRFFIPVSSLVLAGIFICAGYNKIIDPVDFYKSIRMYHLLPDNPAWYLANYLPWLEIVGGIGLLWQRCRCPASLLVSGALGLFIAAILSAWLRGLDIDCGCFGKADISSNYTWLITRDLLMLAAAIYLFQDSFFRKEPKAVPLQ